MNWNEIESNWGVFRRRVKQRWHKLTDQQLAATAGQRNHLASSIAALYQISAEESERQLAAWQAGQHAEVPK